MNIFVLDEKPELAARYHCDKHVVKMIIESAQMLSTAHRILDGTLTTRYDSVKNKYKKHWELQDSRESVLYKVAHHHHPSTKWTIENSANYNWHYRLFVALCNEYTHRYNKIHKTDLLLRNALAILPNNIVSSQNNQLSEFALAMKSNPECMDDNDKVGSYRKFYMTKQSRFSMVWSKRKTPTWFKCDMLTA